jgi:hypothetical protein
VLAEASARGSGTDAVLNVATRPAQGAAWGFTLNYGPTTAHALVLRKGCGYSMKITTTFRVIYSTFAFRFQYHRCTISENSMLIRR